MPGGTLLLLLLRSAAVASPGTGPAYFVAAVEAEADPTGFVVDVEPL